MKIFPQLLQLWGREFLNLLRLFFAFATIESLYSFRNGIHILCQIGLFLNVFSITTEYLNGIFSSCTLAICFDCMSFWRKSKVTLSQIKACYLHVRMKYVISSSSFHSREALQILRMNVTFPSLTDSMWYDQLLESFYLSLQLWQLCWFCIYLFTFFDMCYPNVISKDDELFLQMSQVKSFFCQEFL